jgi:hypothetical protein
MSWFAKAASMNSSALSEALSISSLGFMVMVNDLPSRKPDVSEIGEFRWDTAPGGD